MPTLHNPTNRPQAGAVSPCNYYHLRKAAAIELCEQFGISLPSGYRHLKRGTIPASHRRIGKDGKRYPASLEATHRSPLETDLRLARQAIKRAANRGTTLGQPERDLAFEVFGLVSQMLGGTQ